MLNRLPFYTGILIKSTTFKMSNVFLLERYEILKKMFKLLVLIRKIYAE